MPTSGDSVSQVQEALRDVEDFKENVEVCVKQILIDLVFNYF